MSGAGRDRILARLRAANAAAAATVGLAAPGEAWFAPIADPGTRFEQECLANRTELRRVSSSGEAAGLEALLRSPLPGDAVTAGNILVQDATPLRQLAAQLPIDLRRRLRWSGTAETDVCGITRAEALVARTGSVLVSTRCGGRAGSVLPPFHIVVAEANQLVAELDSALELILGSASMYSLITGPSRTSDIEKKLVLGAHGPRRLAILLRD